MIGTPSIIVVAATLAVFANATTDFCKLTTCNGPHHTICKFGFLNVDRNKCGNPQSTSLTANEIQEILDLHNSYRAYVGSGQELRGKPGPQPAATNLGDLSWDEELANIAQSWADQCVFRHDQCRNCERFRVGQNIAVALSSEGYRKKYTDLVTMWYDEVNNFNRNQVRSATNFTDVGHYNNEVGKKYRMRQGRKCIFTSCEFLPSPRSGIKLHARNFTNVGHYNNEVGKKYRMRQGRKCIFTSCEFLPSPRSGIKLHARNFTDVGHYTQMIWANTKLLGCGGVRYKDSTWYRIYLVCNYGPTGNWVGAQMYNPR